MTNRLASDAIPPNGGSPTIARSESTRQSRLTQAIDEFYAAIDAGHAVDRALLLEKYADVADELAECLANLDFIEQVAPQLAPRNPPPRSAGEGLGEGPRAAALGDYRLLRELGRGGMGVVYEAEQLSLGRRVALKVLPFAAMLDKQQLARFKNEARAAATLDHPNIVAIYSVGTERGVHYYAMQLIEGMSLAQVIAAQRHAQNPPPSKGGARGGIDDRGLPNIEAIDATASFQSKIQTPNSKIDTQPVAALSTLPDFNSRDYYRTVARLGIQAAEALDHAHQNGVLHRDIKPGNLMIDAAGKLWITDFGLARIEADAGMTMTGDLVGTLRYMSPEQALAKRVVIDHRSDIYSLGVTLYELITLRPAFAGDDRQELLRQIAFDDPRKPRQTNARIPQDLETIVLKAIEKNPTDRYASAQDLSDDLQRFVDDQTIRAKRPSPLAITFKWSRRHRVLVAAAAIILVLVTVGSIVSAALLFWERERTARANAQSQAVIKFLVNDLLTAPLDEDKLERDVTVSDVLANADAKIEQALAHQPRVEAFVRTTMAQTYNQLRKYEQAERQAQLARSLAASQHDFDDNGLYGATYELATALAEQLKLDEARRACDELVEAYRRDFGEEHARTIQATNLLIDVRLGTAEYGLNDAANHLQLCRDQLDQCRRVLGPEHPMTLAAMDNLGSCFRILDRHQEAQAVSQQALKTAQRTLAPDDKLMKTLKMGAALDLRRSGRYDEAANLIEDILNANRRTYGIRNITTLQTTIWLAKTNVDRGRFAEAVALYQQLYDSSRAMFGPDHPRTIEAEYSLAYGLRHQGSYQASLDLTLPVLDWKRQNLGPTHPDTLLSMRDGARLLARLGRLDEARDMIDQAIAILPEEERAERESLAWLLATYPVDGIRDGKRAVKLATQACEMIGYKESSPIDTLAGAYAEAGDFKSAIKWERKALEVATQAVSRAKYTRHLESYKNGKPWREE